MFRRVFPVFLLLTLVSLAAANSGKVEPVGAFTDQSAAESVRNALEAKGARVVLADGTALCEVWLRSAVPTRPKAEEAGANYTELNPSTLVGVISFPKGGKDFRGQAIKAGAYTLRYALMPNDGNHLGAAPARDFLLLVPVSADRDPNAQYKFEELVKLSKQASGTNHPATFNLGQAEGQKALPAVISNEAGHVLFASKLKTQAGAELPIALVVQGVSEH